MRKHLTTTRDNQRDVVMLLVRVEFANFIRDRRHGRQTWQLTMPPETIDEQFFSKLISGVVAGFSNTVGVERQQISRTKFAIRDGAVPVAKQTEQRSRRLQPFTISILPEHES